MLTMVVMMMASKTFVYFRFFFIAREITLGNRVIVSRVHGDTQKHKR